MRKKIFASIFGTAVITILVIMVIILGVLDGYFTKIQKDELINQAELASAGVEQQGASFLKHAPENSDRYTLIAKDGTVIYDSEAKASGMENHKNREEVKEAQKTGKGESTRYSVTRMEETHYIARRLNDGSVVRVSAVRISLFGLIVSLLQPIIIIVTIALLISLFLAYRLTKGIVDPLQAMDLEHPSRSCPYEELVPLMNKVQQQVTLINSQRRELESSKMEFDAITSNMEEGLLLIGSEGRIISINPSAAKFFGTDRDCLNKNIMAIEKDQRIDMAILKTKEQGHSSLQISRYGKEYQLNMSRVDSSKDRFGIIILVFDNTDRIHAERNRREFTANVSHELKTPMHSIMGSAELIESGMAQGDDVKVFAGKIRKDAGRLVGLIEDIIHLSKLDEGAPVISEPLELKSLIAEESEALAPLAQEKNVTTSVNGDQVFLVSSRELLHEVFYNLIENAIKYNVDGGSVTVTTKMEGDRARISVKDTGIGIPEEDQERVFERFYRVDKSRSKETGGTGLGLSIVKHAVLDMGGSVNLSSKKGAGTEIEILLPIMHNTDSEDSGAISEI